MIPRLPLSLGRSELINASTWVRYGVAAMLVLAAAVLRIGLTLFFNRPWVSAPLFLLAIMISTWSGGLRLGLFSSLLSGLVLDYFFVQPLIGSLSVYDRVVRVGLYFGEGYIVSWLMEKLRRAGDEMTSSREELRELSERQRAERDAELKSIAREIHDELGQALTGLKLEIHVLQRKLSAVESGRPDAEVTAGLNNLSKQVDSTIGTVRRISSELRPAILDDFGLVAALEWQAKEFGRKSDITCTFRSNSESIDVDPETTTALFRIAQEALTNVVRHAEATSVTVRIGKNNGRITLQVEDDGCGIDPQEAVGPKSLGILGMRERARLIGAEIKIRRSELGGTLVELVVDKHGKWPSSE